LHLPRALAAIALLPSFDDEHVIRHETAVAAVDVVAVLAALTLRPTVVRLFGDRVNSLRVRLGRDSRRSSEGGAFWTRTTGAVIRHPVLSVVSSVGVLLAAR
jgi:uncharacterized membrane protein YdfJ with MMPL/SSD domain